MHNGVLVVQNFFGVDYPTGVAIVHDLMKSRLRQFLHVAEVELPVLYDDFGLDAEAREVLAGYVLELKHWIAGILIWHRLPPVPRGGPAARARRSLAPRRSYGARHLGGAGDTADGRAGGQQGVAPPPQHPAPARRVNLTTGRGRMR